MFVVEARRAAQRPIWCRQSSLLFAMFRSSRKVSAKSLPGARIHSSISPHQIQTSQTILVGRRCGAVGGGWRLAMLAVIERSRQQSESAIGVRSLAAQQFCADRHATRLMHS
jgi:hypothetical protein